MIVCIRYDDSIFFPDRYKSFQWYICWPPTAKVVAYINLVVHHEAHLYSIRWHLLERWYLVYLTDSCRISVGGRISVASLLSRNMYGP